MMIIAALIGNHVVEASGDDMGAERIPWECDRFTGVAFPHHCGDVDARGRNGSKWLEVSCWNDRKEQGQSAIVGHAEVQAKWFSRGSLKEAEVKVPTTRGSSSDHRWLVLDPHSTPALLRTFRPVTHTSLSGVSIKKATRLASDRYSPHRHAPADV